MAPMDFRHELLLVLNYGDPQALRRLLQMRFNDEAGPLLKIPDEALEQAFHMVRQKVPGVRAELVEESRTFLTRR